MKLTDDQVKQYQEDGLLLLPDVFSPDEMTMLFNAFTRDSQSTGDHIITEDRRRKGEQDTKLVRAIYASHLRCPEFADMARDPRLLGPVRQMLTPDVYIYQFKINAKAAFGGEKWAWHQDYLAWEMADQLPAPRLVNVALFLDEVNEFNGPVVYVPGSHRDGQVGEKRSGEARSTQHVDPYDIAVSDERMTHLVKKKGLTSPKGRAGTVLFFDPEVVHGSSQNMSPYQRTLLIVTYNDVTNLPRRSPPRPEYVVCRDTRPLQPLERPLLDATKRSA